MSPARVAGTLHPFRGLLAWWLQELKDANETWKEHDGALRSTRFQLKLDADQAVLTRLGDVTGEARTFTWANGALPPLEEIWPARKPRKARIDLVLAAADVLTFELQLPPLPAHEVRQAVELQLERKLPLARELLHVDWSVAQKHADRSRTISVAAVRQRLINQWRERLAAWPWPLARVRCLDVNGELHFNLLPRARTRVSFEFGRREAQLACLGAGLVLGHALMTTGGWMYERVSLAAEIERARAQIAGVDTLRATLETVSAPIVALRKLNEAPNAGDALLALSTSLPSNAWVYQADIRAPASVPTSMTVEGYTPSAATLVQALEQTRQFDGLQLLETSAAAAPGLNRIKLQAHLLRRDAP